MLNYILRHDNPLVWLLYFPLGLITLAALSIVIAVSWPVYLVAQLGKYTYYMLRDEV